MLGMWCYDGLKSATTKSHFGGVMKPIRELFGRSIAPLHEACLQRARRITSSSKHCLVVEEAALFPPNSEVTDFNTRHTEGRITYGHHGTRARASDEDSLGVGVVLLEGVGDHVGNGVAVTTTTVLQGLLRRDIPASTSLFDG